METTPHHVEAAGR